jgi:hypothetical protein
MNYINKISAALAIAILYSLPSFSQNYRLTWGEDIKLKKGTADLDIIAADRTGLFFTEERKKSTIGLFGSGLTSSYRLVKLDQNFGEQFDKEYKRELKGVTFHSFEKMGDDIYMFASDYDRKERAFSILGAMIDKSSGDLTGDFKELGRYQLESRRDDYEIKLTRILNGKALLMVSNISGKDRVSLGVSVLDNNLKKKQNTVINISFDPGLYQLQDVQITSSNKVVVLGKLFEEVQYGKKKRKRLVFKEYSLSIFNADGIKEKDVTLDSDDRYIISGKLIEQPSGEMLLAGFYSKNAKKEDISGFYINKVDPEKGVLLLSSFQDINSGMLGKPFTDDSDDDDETKQNKRDAERARAADEEEEFPNQFIIKSVDINPVDNSVLITSEISRYSYYSYTTSNYNSSTRTYQYTTTYVHRFTNQDILVINADKEGKIRWINDIPKSQVEEIRTTNTHNSGFYFDNDRGSYFANGGGMPFHSSYSTMILNNNLILLLNDHTANNVNPQYGDRVKTVYNFRKRSNVYGVSIDLATGKMTRKTIVSNNDETILMPRHALIVNNEFFVPSWRQHALAKTELKFAKISVK